MRKPKTFPNQSIVVIHREMPTKKDSFLTIKKENLIRAYKDLKHTTFVLYVYLACNADNYMKAHSVQAIENEWGMPSTTARDQFSKLIEKKYLVQRNEGSNIYDFYEVPQV